MKFIIDEKTKEDMASLHPITQYLLGNPLFVEMAKIMACCDRNLPVKINGEILKVTHYYYDYDPFGPSEMKFSYETAEWSGPYENVIEVDVDLFK